MDYDFTLRAKGVDELREQLRALRADGVQAFGDVGQAATTGVARMDAAQREHGGTVDRTGQSYAALAQRVAGLNAAAGAAPAAFTGMNQTLVIVEAQTTRTGAALAAYTTTMQSADHVAVALADAVEGAVGHITDLGETVVGATTKIVAFGAAIVGALELGSIVSNIRKMRDQMSGTKQDMADLGDQAERTGVSISHMVVHWGAYRIAAGAANLAGLSWTATAVTLVGRMNMVTGAALLLDWALSPLINTGGNIIAVQQGLQKELERTNFAAGVTSQQILDLARSEAAHGVSSREAITAGAQALLAYGSVSTPIYTRSVTLLDEMSQRFGIDVPQAAKILGEALKDPISGLGGLTQAGVLFTRETLDAIKAAEELGDVEKARALVLDAVQRKTEEFSVTMTYQARSSREAQQAQNNFSESINNLVDSVSPLLVRLKEIRDGIADLFTGPSTWVDNKGAALINWIAGGITEALDSETTLDERVTEAGRKVAAIQQQISEGAQRNDLLSRTRAQRLQADLEAAQSEYQRLLDASHAAELEAERTKASELRTASERRSATLKDIDGVVDQGLESRIKAINAEMDKLIEKVELVRAPDGSNDGEIEARIIKIEMLRETKLRDVAATTAQTEATDAGTTARGNARNAMEDLLDRIIRERDALSETERERTINNAALEAERVARGKLTGGPLAEYIRQVEYEAAVTYDAKKARDAKAESDRQASQATEAYARDVARVSENTAKDVASNLWDQITDQAKAGDAHRFVINWVKRLGVELLAQRLILPVTMQVVGAVPGLFGISGGGGATTSGGTMTAQGGAGTAGSLGQISSLSNLASGSQSLYNVGSWLATSQAGQALGLSSTMGTANLAEAGVMGVQGGMQAGAVSMTGLGSAFAQGLGYSPWGIAGSIGASLLGLGKGADPYVNMGLSTLGGIGGGMAGAALGAGGGTILGLQAGSVLGPAGAIIGAALGTALSGLFPADKQIPWGQYASYQGQTRSVEGLDGYDTAPLKQAGDTAVGALQSLASGLGVATTSLPLGGFGYSQDKRGNLAGGWYSFVGGGGFESGSAEGAASADEAVADFLARSLRSADLSSVGDAVKIALANTTAKTTTDLLADLNLAKSIDDATAGLTDLDKSLAGVEAAAKKSAASQYESTKTEYERAKALGLGDQYADILVKQLKSAYGTSADATATLGPLSQSLAALDGQFAALSDATHAMGLALSDAELAAMKAAQAEKILKSYRDQWDTDYRSATGLGAVDQATAIRARWNASWADDLAAGKNPNDLYRVQMQALFAGIGDLTTLNQAAAALDNLDSVAAQFARARAAEVRDATLQDLHLRQLQAQATIAQASGDAQAAAAAQAAADDYQRQLAAQRELTAATDDTVRAQVQATQHMEEQAAVAKRQAEALAQAVQSGQSFLAWIDGKMGTASSAVSASDAYKAASDAYERDLGLARGNDADALSRLTQDADRLLTAYQGLNGSSGAAGFQNQILAQIAALPATQSYAASQGLQSVVDAITSLPHAAGGPELLRLPDGTEVITAKSSVEMMRRAMGGLGGLGGGASSGVDDIVLAIVTVGGRTIDALRQEFAALKAGQDELLGEFRLLRDGAGVQPWRR